MLMPSVQGMAARVMHPNPSSFDTPKSGGCDSRSSSVCWLGQGRFIFFFSFNLTSALLCSVLYCPLLERSINAVSPLPRSDSTKVSLLFDSVSGRHNARRRSGMDGRRGGDGEYLAGATVASEGRDTSSVYGLEKEVGRSLFREHEPIGTASHLLLALAWMFSAGLICQNIFRALAARQTQHNTAHRPVHHRFLFGFV